MKPLRYCHMLFAETISQLLKSRFKFGSVDNVD